MSFLSSCIHGFFYSPRRYMLNVLKINCMCLLPIATAFRSPCQNANKQCLKSFSNTTICKMQITTAYLRPAELKNMNIMTSHGPTAHVTHCHSAGQTIALVTNRPSFNCLIYIQLRLILWIVITGTCTCAAIQQCKLQCITRLQSLKLQLSYSYSKRVLKQVDL